MDAESLVWALNFNQRALNLNLESVTHEDSLVQPPSGNCINWLLGHILAHRNVMLQALGEEPLWNPEAQSRYQRGSEPIRGEEAGVERLERLREEMERSRERLETAILGLPRDGLAAPSGSGTLGQRLLFLNLHEAYHVGQIGLVRRVAGKEGAIR